MTTTVPDAAAAAGTTPAAFKDFVPASYHDRGYLKDLLDKPQGAETTEELFKRLDGAQKLIGTRAPAAIPGDDAKPEDIDAFLAKLRPEKPDAYDFKALENGGEKDEPLLAALRDSFHHAGNSKAQVNRFLEKFAPVFAERGKAAAAEKKAQDDAFDALVAQAHGADSAKALETTKAALNEFTPEAFKPHLEKLSNENLAIMSSIINGIVAKYGIEDKIKPAGGSGAAGGDVEALRSEMQSIIAKPEYKDEFSPAHAAARAKVAELAQKIAAAK